VPWVFCLSEDGRFVLVQNNHTRAGEDGPDSVVVFARDEESGLLRATGAKLSFPTVSSVWDLMLPRL
jgi:6-phosphogluconolactonase (cycloisomerase 2 family)